MYRSFTPKGFSKNKLRDHIVNDLRLRTWHVETMHGNSQQYGIPGIYAFHKDYGERWIKPGGKSFTKAQLAKFPMFRHHSVGIWVMPEANEDILFKPPNWVEFVPASKVTDLDKQFKFRIEGRWTGPEAKIQRAIIDKLLSWDWHVEVMFGNAYQCGIPDLYAMKKGQGTRWIEVKNPHSYAFTSNQKRKFPIFEKKGLKIWVICSDEKDELYKIQQEPNWRQYL